MNNVLESVIHNNTIIEVVQDLDPMNPRDWDNVGHMVCWHSRYNLGDTNTDYNIKDYDSAEELFNAIKKDAICVMPLYLYDHSGISMSTGSFVGRAHHAGWDSGLVGYIYASKDDFDNAGINLNEVTAEEVLTTEVKVYDKYLQGDFYGYRAIRLDQCDSCGHVEREIVDSCWGYDSIEEAINASKENTNA